MQDLNHVAKLNSPAYVAERYGGKAAGLAVVQRKKAATVPRTMLVHSAESLSSFSGYQKSYHQYKLRGIAGKPGLLAIRSSAISEKGTGEDSQTHSYAGQHESVLNVNVESWDEVCGAIQKVRDSLSNSTAYSEATGGSVNKMGVLIQRMVAPTYSGVLFTSDPFTAEKGVSVIEWVKGLGDKLVDGSVNPDGSLRVIHGSNEVLEGNTPKWLWRKVIDMGQRVAIAFEQPMDVEWAYKSGNVYCLQARPITGNIEWKVGELGGLPVVEGLASGIGYWAPDNVTPHDVGWEDGGNVVPFEKGGVLMAHMTSPAMVPAMVRASAITTEIGGRMCHAAIVARELGKPCIVRVSDLQWLAGQNVTVDGYRGVIYASSE